MQGVTIDKEIGRADHNLRVDHRSRRQRDRTDADRRQLAADAAADGEETSIIKPAT